MGSSWLRLKCPNGIRSVPAFSVNAGSNSNESSAFSTTISPSAGPPVPACSISTSESKWMLSEISAWIIGTSRMSTNEPRFPGSCDDT